MVSAREFEETSVWLPEEMKSLQTSSSEGRQLLEGLTGGWSLKSVAKNRKDKLIEDREDEEPQLPEKLQNLDRTSSDSEHMRKTAEEAEESR